MSEAVELYKKLEDGNMAPTGIFYCSECRVVHPTEKQAQRCHGEALCACGGKIEDRYGDLCSNCRMKERRSKDAAREAERFEKATKITESEYKGEMVYVDDRYSDCIEDAIDNYLPGQEPEYVWACKDQAVPFANAESIYENLLDNMWEDASVDDLNGIDELEAAVKAFNEANRSISVFVPDYSTAILVNTRPLEEIPQ